MIWIWQDCQRKDLVQCFDLCFYLQEFEVAYEPANVKYKNTP